MTDPRTDAPVRTDAETLRACPFCGGTAHRVELSTEETDPNAGGSVIECKRCGASSHVEFGFKENLEDAWNKRCADRDERAAKGVEGLANDVVTEVCELPDRTSPEDQPDMLLVTTDELHAIIVDVLAPHLAAAEESGRAKEIELRGVASVLAESDGVWRTCSGCHDSVDGYDVGRYPYSTTLKCKLGYGCRECGGIGAIWDTTDYADMGDFLSAPAERAYTQAERDAAKKKLFSAIDALRPFGSAARIVSWSERVINRSFPSDAAISSGLAWRTKDGSTRTITYGDLRLADCLVSDFDKSCALSEQQGEPR